MRAFLVAGYAVLVSGCVSIPSTAGFSAAETGLVTSRPGPGASDVYSDAAQTPAVSLTDHLLSLCTAENGFALGAAGAKDQGLCTGDLAADFTVAFLKGADLYAARLEVEQTKVEIAAAQRELWTARRDVKTIDVALASLDTPTDRRAGLKAARIARVADEQRQAEALAQLQVKLAAAEAVAMARSAILSVVPEDGAGDAPEAAVLTPASY